MCIFISCVSPKMCLFWMFVLNGFSYPGVRSSWKSVLSGKNSGMTFCLCVCNSETTINFQSCYKQRLQKGKCVCYVGSTLWDKQNNLELSEVTALLWAHGFIFITVQVGCRSCLLSVASFSFISSPLLCFQGKLFTWHYDSIQFSFFLTFQWIAICFFTCFWTHYKKL